MNGFNLEGFLIPAVICFFNVKFGLIVLTFSRFCLLSFWSKRLVLKLYILALNERYL